MARTNCICNENTYRETANNDQVMVPLRVVGDGESAQDQILSALLNDEPCKGKLKIILKKFKKMKKTEKKEKK